MLDLLPRLRRFAYGLTGSVEEGDDLVQATCERAIRAIDTWQAGTRMDSWMFRIARNQFFNQIRAAKVRGPHLELADNDSRLQVDGAGAVESQLTLAAVRRLAARLPEEQRSVLMLVCVEGLPYKEVAQILDLPIGTVTSRLARARLTLKDGLDADAGARPREADTV
jgi:RNA polymerase sigma-70 factor (ECF subfamily)